MIILGLDSCGKYLSVALSDGPDLLSNITDFSELSQAENIVPIIEEILKKSSLTYKDIDYLAVTSGPGSFTGVRIGLACADAISLATRVKTISISTPDSISYKMINQSRTFDFYVPIIRASRREFYIQIFDKNNLAKSDIELIEIDHLASYIRHLNGLITIGGSGISQIEHFTNQNDQSKITFLPRFPYTEARILCKRAYELIMQNNYISNLDPIYIRKPDAKIGKNTNLLL